MVADKSGQATWRLEDVMPAHAGKEFEGILAKLKSDTAEFESLRARLPLFGKQEMEKALGLYERITERLTRVGCYALLLFSEDTRNQEAKALLDRAEELRADVDNLVLFFRLWWIGLDDAKAAALTPTNRDHAYYLSSLRKLRPHTLEEKVEQAVNLKNTTGFSSWTHHYDQITTDYTYELRIGGKVLKDSSGKPRMLVRDEVSRLFSSPDAAERKAAYQAINAKYGESGNLLGEVYKTIVRDWRNENVRMRSYASPIAPRNLENDVPDESVAELLRVCGQNAKVFQEFFRVKARMLGMKRMVRYDVYAPLQKQDTKMGYEDAVKLVLAAFTEFDQGFAGMARRVFEAGHVDSGPRKGKESGAFCMSVTPTTVPYLLLNFAGRAKDAYTIAHESGHAVHSQLAGAHSVLTFVPPLVLAETASVFGEMLLFDKMMRDEKSKGVKKAVLLEKISSMYATIGRQANFVIFENDAHRAVSEGATVSALTSLYLSNLKSQFGDAVEVPDEFKWEWTSIPHIYHTPFYCYAYAFGNLLSLALYDRYTKEGKGFVPAYLKILAYGGSERPAKVLDEVGIDISDAGFWQGGFSVMERMVGELQRL